ncbi:phosphorylated adapter RNA export protein [Polypterus senegalus]|uniref:phosphorylated adapter RNA export protein n=1 Tax=Polypterus senegalus TaxID=55291 RepID=UPI001962C938|nr:phosphorylated adapter RNA export protein [Polypterus senegalus]
MEDLEDGELSDSQSDSEMKLATEDQAQKPHPPAFDSHFFQKRREPQPPVASVTHYRSAAGMDSSDNSDTDSDEEKVLWKRKRQKCSNTPAQPVAFALPPATQKSPGHKVNNIWGAVVQEQNQEAVAAELDFLGMEGEISMSCRQSETYNYVLARKLMEKERLEQAGEEMAKLDEELEEYMQDGKTDGKTEQENGTGHLKRKRPIKDRLGKIQEMDYKGRCEITEDDDEEKVIDEITYRLREPKKELIERVVKTIGKKKAIELLMETTEIEQNGGIYTLDGSRRRTPGGVYLNLLKNTPSITHKQIKEIFIDETQKEYANKKAAKKRRRQVLGKKMKQAIKTLNLQEHDDASRETFASDTNEALASLEDSHEGHTETAIDTEDAVDMYNSNDLEIF